ncbi:MAG TPA: hypothetical protein VGL21_07800 [Jatrophihabitantaceae bacterium]
MSAEVLALGRSHALTYRRYEGKLHGAQIDHPGKDGDTCPGGYIYFGEPEGWTLESEDPPTISPSLLCRICGDHGFVRSGRWVPA